LSGSRLWRCLLGILTTAAGSLSGLQAADKPTVVVENIRRVFHNGEHNAFTDLIRWRGKFWLTFRSSPDGHGVNPNAAIIVLNSDDAKTWKEAHRFSVPNRDTRDPHFLDFKGKLFIYAGCWHAGTKEKPVKKEETEMNHHFGYAAFTADGTSWEGPRQLEGTYGHYIWRVASYGGKAYLCARRKFGHTESGDRDMPGGRQSAMLESEDGLRWRYVSNFQDKSGNETAFMFDRDGQVTALSRKTSTTSDLSRSRPPYEKWTRQEIPQFIGGPLIASWGERVLVGGRQSKPAGPRTVLYWLHNDQLVPFAELPSDGDNSYPGFVALDAKRGLISWYSTHEKDAQGKPITAIYLADLVITGASR